MNFIKEFEQVSQRAIEQKEQSDVHYQKVLECEKKLLCYPHTDAVIKEKSKGNIWLIFGILFFFLEVAITVVIYEKVHEGVIGIWIWLSIPLIVGITQKARGLREYRQIVATYGSLQTITTTRAELEQELAKLKAESQQLLDIYCETKVHLDELMVYDGKDWKLSKFKATTNNVRAMELDTEKIYVILQHLRPSELQNWHTNWMMYGDNGPNTAGFQELGLSGSWKLQVTQVVLRFIHSVQPSSRHIPGDNEWDHLMKEANIRDAQTGDEQAYLDFAYIGALIMAKRRVEIFSKIPL